MPNGLPAPSWQQLVKNSITDINILVSTLGLPEQPHFSQFPILVPEPYLSRIEMNNPDDPLLQQVLSSPMETRQFHGYTKQPLNEHKYSPTVGLIQKYQGRTLIIATGKCAINCRYCFRRHFPYQSFQPDSRQWQRLFRTINNDTTINEVILSGGDPLILSDKHIKRIVNNLENISQLHTLRLHTRMPVVIPQRVTKQLLDWIANTRLKVIFVNHINHPNEIDQQVINAMQLLHKAGAILLNQSVLLRNINDSDYTLVSLSQKLIKAGILPYYIHLLDPVEGAAHFYVDKTQAIELINKIRSQLPGYLVPRLVQEIPGGASKQHI